MKVCTDASLFGAYTAATIQHTTFNIQHILDIGAGTGLLSLMLAQKNDAVIDAVELDTPACQQAKTNFEESPWKDRLHIFNEDILAFQSKKKYDLVICNPPFYDNDLRSPDDVKNTAKHSGTLNLAELIKIAFVQLTATGYFAVLLPAHRVNSFENLAAMQGFYLWQKVMVRQTETHDHFRGILIFSKEKKEEQSISMAIKNKEEKYTAEFTALLKDYYLYLN